MFFFNYGNTWSNYGPDNFGIKRVGLLIVSPVVGLGLGGPKARLKSGPSDDVIVLSQP